MQRMAVKTKCIATVASLLLASHAIAAEVTPVVPGCNMAKANYSSSTVGASSVQLVPAPPQGTVRSGLFIELLSASATLAVNTIGASASTTAPGNIVISTGASSPQNVAYINFASMGFIPQGQVNAIASGTVTVSVFACPQ